MNPIQNKNQLQNQLQNQNISSANIVSVIDQTTSLTVKLSEDTKKLSDEINSLKFSNHSLTNKCADLEQKVSNLLKIVVEGNGQRALTTRVFSVEDAIAEMKSDMKDSFHLSKEHLLRLELNINEIQDEQKNKANAVAERGWNIFQQLVPIAIVAIITLASSGFISSIQSDSDEELKSYISKLEKTIEELKKN